MKKFYLNTTKEDLDSWKNQMAFVRSFVHKDKWIDGKNTLKVMEEIYNNMKIEFATGQGLWLN